MTGTPHLVYHREIATPHIAQHGSQLSKDVCCLYFAAPPWLLYVRDRLALRIVSICCVLLSTFQRSLVLDMDPFAPSSGESDAALQDPFSLVSEDISSISENIQGLLGVDHPVLQTVASYLFARDGGKKVRPALVLLMAGAVRDTAAQNPAPDSAEHEQVLAGDPILTHVGAQEACTSAEAAWSA